MVAAYAVMLLACLHQVAQTATWRPLAWTGPDQQQRHQQLLLPFSTFHTAIFGVLANITFGSHASLSTQPSTATSVIALNQSKSRY